MSKFVTIYALIWFGAYLWEKWRYRKEPVPARFERLWR